MWFWSKAATEPSPAKSGTSGGLTAAPQSPPASPSLAAHWAEAPGSEAAALDTVPASPSSAFQQQAQPEGSGHGPPGHRSRSAYFEQEELHERPELHGPPPVRTSLPLVTAPQPVGKSPKGFSLTRCALHGCLEAAEYEGPDGRRQKHRYPTHKPGPMSLQACQF